MKKLAKVLVFMLVIAMACVACFGLVACDDGGDVIEITTKTMFGAGDDHATGWNALKTKFSGTKQTYVDKDGNVKEVTVKFKDLSIAVGDDFDKQITNSFNSSSSAPDLLYTFSGERNAEYNNYLANANDAVAKIIGYDSKLDVSNFGVRGDDKTIGWKTGFQLGIMYDNTKMAAADFASISAMQTKMAALASTATPSVNASGETNTWMNFFALQELGSAFASADPMKIDSAYWTANKAKLISATEKFLSFAKDAGWNSDKDYGTEKAAFASGNRAVTADGSWAVNGLIHTDKDDPSTLNEKIKYAAFPLTGEAAEYAMTGADHGWQLNKSLLEDKDAARAKLQIVAKFMQMNYVDYSEYIKGGAGGVCLNGVGSDVLKGVTLDMSNSLIGKKSVLPLENRSAIIQNTFFASATGLNAAVRAGLTGNQAATAIWQSCADGFTAAA